MAVKQNIQITRTNIPLWNKFIITVSNYTKSLLTINSSNILRKFGDQKLKHPFIGYNDWFKIQSDYALFMISIPYGLTDSVDDAISDLEEVYANLDLNNLKTSDIISLMDYMRDVYRKVLVFNNFVLSLNTANFPKGQLAAASYQYENKFY